MTTPSDGPSTPKPSKFPKFKRHGHEHEPDVPVPRAPSPEVVEVLDDIVHVPTISTTDLALEEDGRVLSDSGESSSPQESSAGPEEDTSQPPQLKVNRFADPESLSTRKWYQALVASRAGFDRMVVTSPNRFWIPEYPRETTVIETFMDGHWGKHEYSLHPQDLCRGWWHLACIPMQHASGSLVLADFLDPKVDWEPQGGLGFDGLGYITLERQVDLMVVAKDTIRACEKLKVPATVRKYTRFLSTILQTFVDRMRHLPATPTIAISVAAHIQRLTLELLGVKNYMQIVVPRLESNGDYSNEVLPFLGAFVRDGSDAATLTRVGLPVFFLQPLTRRLAVWEVVEADSRAYIENTRPCDPPILHHPQAFAGVGNFSGSWQRNMVLAVSKHLGGAHLSTLSLAQVPDVPDPLRLPGDTEHGKEKRQRLEGPEAAGKHLARVAAATPQVASPSQKKAHRGRRGGGKRPGASGGASTIPDTFVGSQVPPTAPVLRPAVLPAPQPAKTFVPLLFGEVSSAWEVALRAASPVPRTASAFFFYPPPFLMDTIFDTASLQSVPIERAPFARFDEKVNRYIHNFVRIRPFLRARIFDPSLSHEPLSIADWRAALWGDYRPKNHPIRQQGSAGDRRRAKRRQEGHNDVSRVLSRVAEYSSYDAMMVAPYDGEPVDYRTASTSTDLRRRILWECHEINFRAEVTALDTLLVQSPSWWEVHRWQREADITALWGVPQTVTSVVPRVVEEDRKFRWNSDPADQSSKATLKALLSLIKIWPHCPDVLVGAARREWADTEFVDIQGRAIEFYVRTFVKTFMRLPTAPIPYPLTA